MKSNVPITESRPCPICGSKELQTVFQLPDIPLGDRFTINAQAAMSLRSYPLRVDRCCRCGHCFVPFTTEPDESYQHYLFESGQSPGLSRSFSEIVSDLGRRHSLTERDLILDIGANDGTWLSCFESMGCDLIAVEPAPVPAEAAARRGITVINDYFSEASIHRTGLLVRAPRLISMNYVFANLPDPIQVLKDVAAIANENTIISILTGYHPAQLSVAMFDYVYHEHLSYYSCQDFLNMAESLGLTISYCREMPLKGGSLHIELRKASSKGHNSDLFGLMLKREAWLDQPMNNQWTIMNDNLNRTRGLVQKAIEKARLQKRTLLGYGASHSTTTLLYSLGIESSLDFVVDDNPAKQGKYSPGTGIQVRSPECLEAFSDACVIILAWQHGPQIIDALKRKLFSGIVISPFPNYTEKKLS